MKPLPRTPLGGAWSGMEAPPTPASIPQTGSLQDMRVSLSTYLTRSTRSWLKPSSAGFPVLGESSVLLPIWEVSLLPRLEALGDWSVTSWAEPFQPERKEKNHLRNSTAAAGKSRSCSSNLYGTCAESRASPTCPPASLRACEPQPASPADPEDRGCGVRRGGEGWLGGPRKQKELPFPSGSLGPPPVSFGSLLLAPQEHWKLLSPLAQQARFLSLKLSLFLTLPSSGG